MPSVWPMVHVTLAGLLAIPILWETMHDYQKNRILAFLDSELATRRATAGTRSSRSSRSARGKIWGKGFLRGHAEPVRLPARALDRLPVLGVGRGVGLRRLGRSCSRSSAFLLVWILNVALSARDRVGAVICVGVAAMTFWHVRRQRRDGARPRAGRRRDAAVHLLRRQLARDRSSSRWASSRTSRCASTATSRPSGARRRVGHVEIGIPTPMRVATGV